MPRLFTPDGRPLDQRVFELDPISRVIVERMRDGVRTKLETLTKPCKCAHEHRQKHYTDAGGDVTSYRFELEVLCPEAAREDYPNCAHVESCGRDPDPFGKEIRTLTAMKILDAQSWSGWLQKMRFAILAVDNAIALSVHGGTQKTIEPLPDGTTPEGLQEPNLAELRQKGTMLLGILHGALLEKSTQ